MARKTVVELIDDIDGQTAAESITFALDGLSYEIDLSTANADKLRTSLAPFAEHARKGGATKTGRRSGSTGPRTTGNRERSAEVRSWAKQHGLVVNDRGRIPATVIDAYEANDPSKAVGPTSKVPQAAFQGVSNP
jgi:hypothetical protein